jgi:hypothetical protein
MKLFILTYLELNICLGCCVRFHSKVYHSGFDLQIRLATGAKIHTAPDQENKSQLNTIVR